MRRGIRRREKRKGRRMNEERKIEEIQCTCQSASGSGCNHSWLTELLEQSRILELHLFRKLL